jgi:hypothetical protein
MHSEAMKPLISEARLYLMRHGIVNKRWKDTGDQNWQMLMAYFLLKGTGSASSRPLSSASLGET